MVDFSSSKFAPKNGCRQELAGQQFDSHNTSQPCGARSGAPWTLSHQRLILDCIRGISVYHSYGTITIQNWKKNHGWFVYAFQLRMRRQGLPFVKLNYCIRDKRTCVQSWESLANTETIECWMCNFLFSVCWPCFCRLHCAFWLSIRNQICFKISAGLSSAFPKRALSVTGHRGLCMRPCITRLAHCYHRDRSQI